MPETQPADDLAPCPYCGRMTSSKANFCYYCARELKARAEHPDEGSDEKPVRRKVNWVVVGVVVGLILFILIYSLLHEF
jgi:uncharacterized membrane protein YvbJ